MLSTLHAIVVDPSGALFKQYADLGQALQEHISSLDWQRHVPWVCAVHGLERQRSAAAHLRQGLIGNSWAKEYSARPSSCKSLRTEIGPGDVA